MSCEILEFLFYCSALSQGVVIILRGARQKIVSSSRDSMFQMNLKKKEIFIPLSNYVITQKC